MEKIMVDFIIFDGWSNRFSKMDSKLEAQVDKGGTPSWTLSQNTTALAGKIDTPPPHERKPHPLSDF